MRPESSGKRMSQQSMCSLFYHSKIAFFFKFSSLLSLYSTLLSNQPPTKWLKFVHFWVEYQQEVDYVLEDRAGRLVGIEVKKSASPTSSDFRGLRHLAEQTGKKFLRGILLYTGTESVSFGPDPHAVPLAALWKKHSTSNESSC